MSYRLDVQFESTDREEFDVVFLDYKSETYSTLCILRNFLLVLFGFSMFLPYVWGVFFFFLYRMYKVGKFPHDIQHFDNAQLEVLNIMKNFFIACNQQQKKISGQKIREFKVFKEIFESQNDIKNFLPFEIRFMRFIRRECYTPFQLIVSEVLVVPEKYNELTNSITRMHV